MSISVDSKYIGIISHRLRNFKRKNDYVWNFSCPVCGDSKKNASKARGYVYKKGNNLFYSCKNCGLGTSLGKLLEHVDGTIYKEYILERYKSGENGNSNFKDPTFNVPSPRFGKLDKPKQFEYAEFCSDLPSGHFCLDYLKNRKIPKEFYSQLLFTSHYKKFVDALVPDHGKKLVDDARVIIPFYDVYNNLIAVSGRALETNDHKLRYIKIRSQDMIEKLMYGLDKVDKSQLVRIVEGEFDSMFLTNCVASGDSSLSLTADIIKAKNNVLIFDNEPRNKEIVKLQEDAIKSGHNVVIWPDNIEGKDINEMILNGHEASEIQDIIDSNTFYGLNAIAQFTFWKKI